MRNKLKDSPNGCMKKILFATYCLITVFFAVSQNQKAPQEISKDLYQKIAQATRVSFEKYTLTAPDWLPNNIALIRLKGLDDEEFLDELHNVIADIRIKALVIVFSSNEIDPGLLMREIELAKKLKPVVALIQDKCLAERFIAATAATYVVGLPSVRVGDIGAVYNMEKHIPLDATIIRQKDTYSVIDEVYTGGLCKGFFSRFETDNSSAKHHCLENVEQLVNNNYKEMCDSIARYRLLDRSKDDIWGHGRRFWTQEAHDLGLIDSVGGLQDAIDVAQKLSEEIHPARCELSNGFIARDSYCLPVTIATIAIVGEIHNDDHLETAIIERIRTVSIDPSISGIFIIINSPGSDDMTSAIKIGHEIIAAKKNKPVLILVTGMCTSAGYYIASYANAIYATPGSMIGNIGIIMPFQRFDIQKEHIYTDQEAARKYRVESTVVSAGDYTCPDKPCQLSKNEMDHRVQGFYQYFLSVVASNRGMSLSQSSEWAEAKIFSARNALKLGLIDHIGGYTEVVAHLLYLIANRNQGIKLDDLPPLRIVNLNSEEPQGQSKT